MKYSGITTIDNDLLGSCTLGNDSFVGLKSRSIIDQCKVLRECLHFQGPLIKFMSCLVSSNLLKCNPATKACHLIKLNLFPY